MKLINRLLSYIPTALPLGLTEFETWSESIIALLPKGMTNVPTDDLKFVLASAIQHLGQNRSYVPKSYFVSLAHKAAASQVAGQVFYNIKQKQIEAAEKAKQDAEATAQAQVANAQPEIAEAKS